MTPNLNSDNAYEILGVARDAAVSDIRQAFRKLALKNHPDAKPPDEKEAAAQVFAKINQAHETLRDPEKRVAYDRALGRGETPDLTKGPEGAAPFASLGDIIGEIANLGFPIDENAMLAGVDPNLLGLLTPTLIRAGNVRENIVDRIPFSFVASVGRMRGDLLPPGKLTQGFLMVTEVRVIALMRFFHQYQQGDVQYTNTYFRLLSFSYAGLERISVVEEGRARLKYLLCLQDEEGTGLAFVIGSRTAFTRLFLIVNKYKLPLRTSGSADRGREYWRAFGLALIPGLIWCLPFVLQVIGHLVWFACSKCKDSGDFSVRMAWIYELLNSFYVTTAVLYLSPAILMGQIVHVYRSWSLAEVGELFGAPPHDYALGVPEAGPSPEDKPRGAKGRPTRAGPTAPPMLFSPEPAKSPPAGTPQYLRETVPGALAVQPAGAAETWPGTVFDWSSSDPAKAGEPAAAATVPPAAPVWRADVGLPPAKTAAPRPDGQPVVAVPESLAAFYGNEPPAPKGEAAAPQPGERFDPPARRPPEAAKKLACIRCAFGYESQKNVGDWEPCPRCGQPNEVPTTGELEQTARAAATVEGPAPLAQATCPSCRRQVNERVAMCPFCGAILHETEAQQKQSPKKAPPKVFVTCPSCQKPVHERLAVCPFCCAVLDKSPARTGHCDICNAAIVVAPGSIFNIALLRRATRYGYQPPTIPIGIVDLPDARHLVGIPSELLPGGWWPLLLHGCKKQRWALCDSCRDDLVGYCGK